MKKVIITLPDSAGLVSVAVVKSEETEGALQIRLSTETETLTEEVTEIDMTEEETSED